MLKFKGSYFGSTSVCTCNYELLQGNSLHDVVTCTCSVQTRFSVAKTSSFKAALALSSL